MMIGKQHDISSPLELDKRVPFLCVCFASFLFFFIFLEDIFLAQWTRERSTRIPTKSRVNNNLTKMAFSMCRFQLFKLMGSGFRCPVLNWIVEIDATGYRLNSCELTWTCCRVSISRQESICALRSCPGKLKVKTPSPKVSKLLLLFPESLLLFSLFFKILIN